MNLGAILHLNGKLQEAEANYLRALQLKPDDTITQSNLRKLWNIMEKQGLRTMAPWLKHTMWSSVWIIPFYLKWFISLAIWQELPYRDWNVSLIGLGSKLGTLENLLKNCNCNTCKNFSGYFVPGTGLGVLNRSTCVKVGCWFILEVSQYFSY